MRRPYNTLIVEFKVWGEQALIIGLEIKRIRELVKRYWVTEKEIRGRYERIREVEIAYIVSIMGILIKNLEGIVITNRGEEKYKQTIIISKWPC